MTGQHLFLLVKLSSYLSLKEVPTQVDIVNIFRRSEFLPEIVDESIAINAKTVWAQLDIFEKISAQKALNAGRYVVIDTCIKIEYLRLGIG